MGGGPKPNSNVPIVDVPKWLGRGGVRPNWDNVLKYGFFFLKASHLFLTGCHVLKACIRESMLPRALVKFRPMLPFDPGALKLKL